MCKRDRELRAELLEVEYRLAKEAGAGPAALRVSGQLASEARRAAEAQAGGQKERKGERQGVLWS